MVRRTGLKRKRIQVQRYTETRDDFGGVTRTWGNVGGEWWAEVQPLRGLEKEQGDQQKAIRTYKIYMRYFDLGIEEDDRILYGTKVFQVTSVVDPGERHCDTIVEVKEVVQVA